MLNHLLITGLNRSGTTVFQHLLDGHPQLATVPVEDAVWRAQYINNVDIFELWKKGIGDLWLFLHKHSFLSEKRLTERGRLPKDWDDLLFCTDQNNYDIMDFKKRLVERLESSVPDSYQRLLEDIFFSLTPEIFQNYSQKKYLVTKTPKSQKIFRLLFSRYPEGKMIVMVRSPEKSYASQQYSRLRDKEIEKDETEVLIRNAVRYCLSWNDYHRSVLEAQKRFPKSVLTVRLEDISADIEGQMRRVSDFLSIDYDPIMLRPTIYGNPWEGNSQQRSTIKGFSAAVSSSSKTDILGDDELYILSRNLGEVYKKYGYEQPMISLSSVKRFRLSVLNMYYKTINSLQALL